MSLIISRSVVRIHLPQQKWVCRNQGDRATGGYPVAHTSSSLVKSTNKWCLTCRCSSTVERLICNQQVVGSKPSTGSNLFNGRVVEVVYNAGLSRRWSGFEFPYARYNAYRRLLEYHFIGYSQRTTKQRLHSSMDRT